MVSPPARGEPPRAPPPRLGLAGRAGLATPLRRVWLGSCEAATPPRRSTPAGLPGLGCFAGWSQQQQLLRGRQPVPSRQSQARVGGETRQAGEDDPLPPEHGAPPREAVPEAAGRRAGGHPPQEPGSLPPGRRGAPADPLVVPSRPNEGLLRLLAKSWQTRRPPRPPPRPPNSSTSMEPPPSSTKGVSAAP